MEKNDPSIQNAPPNEAICSHCGRYVGPLNKCQYCGAPIRQRLSLKFFRWAAVLLATIGLALLYLMSTLHEVPHIRIGEIETTMNFAYIHIEGEVPSDARIYSDAGLVSSLSFHVDDGSGRIQVRAYRKKARHLVESGTVPHKGDHVALEGSLNVSADRTVLYLQVPEKLEIVESAPIEAIELQNLSRKHLGDILMVKGSSGKAFGFPGGNAFYLYGGDTRIKTVLWSNRISGELSRKISKGTDLAVTGEIDSYKDELEIIPRDASDILFLEEAVKNKEGGQ